MFLVISDTDFLNILFIVATLNYISNRADSKLSYFVEYIFMSLSYNDVHNLVLDISSSYQCQNHNWVAYAFCTKLTQPYLYHVFSCLDAV